MKEKILVYLKGKLKTGISNSYLDGLADYYSKTIKEESEIETTLTEGTISLIQLNADQLQIEGDRRATESGETAVKNFKLKFKLDDEGKPTIVADPPKPPENKDEPDWFKTYRESQKEESDALKLKVEGMDKAKLQEVLTEKVKAHEKLKNIPKSYLKGRNLNVDSEDKIEELVTSIESDYNGFKQELVEQGIEIDTPLSSTEKTKEGEAEGLKAAESRNSATSGDDGIPI